MRCAIIRRPVKYLCPRNIDLFYEKMKIADDILERGVQAALRAIGFDNGWLGPRRVTSGRVRQSVSLATSARRSPDRQGVRPRVPLEDRAGLQTGASALLRREPFSNRGNGGEGDLLWAPRAV